MSQVWLGIFGFFFFSKSCLKVGGAAYTRVRLIHEFLRYVISVTWPWQKLNSPEKFYSFMNVEECTLPSRGIEWYIWDFARLWDPWFKPWDQDLKKSRLRDTKSPKTRLRDKSQKNASKVSRSGQNFLTPNFFSKKIMTTFSSDEHVLIFYSMYSSCKI